MCSIVVLNQSTFCEMFYPNRIKNVRSVFLVIIICAVWDIVYGIHACPLDH